jgi:glycosyltransferase involved in cell wall biosynthesis
VLASFPPPGPRTNPYIAQLANALRQTPGVRLSCFSWRRALVGRYDVVHLHWPEILVDGASRPKRLVRQALTAALVARWWLARTAVVRTVHNRAPHERRPPVQRALLRAIDAGTTSRIALNPVDAEADGVQLIPHGHYVDWFAGAAPVAAEAGRVAFAGLIRRYKNVPVLVGAFAALPDPHARLAVLGRPADAALAAELEQLAAGDRRVSLDLRFVEDDELAHELRRAQLIALPYTEMNNSGAALLALSLGRPVLVPDNAVTSCLAAEVGEAWVVRFTGELTADDLAGALESTATLLGTAERPDLSRRSWAEAGVAHREVYGAAVQARRRSGRGRAT